MDPQGKYLVSASQDKTIKILDFKTKEEKYHFKNLHECKSLKTITLLTLKDPLCSAIALSPNKQFIVSGCDDKSIKVFDVQTKKQIHHIREAHKSNLPLSNSQKL